MYREDRRVSHSSSFDRNLFKKEEGKTTTTSKICCGHSGNLCVRKHQKIYTMYSKHLNLTGLGCALRGMATFSPPHNFSSCCREIAVLHWELRFLWSSRVPFCLPLLAATPSLLRSPHQLIKGQKSTGCSCKDSPTDSSPGKELSSAFFRTATG